MLTFFFFLLPLLPLLYLQEELANECGIKKSADVRNLSEHELEEKGRQAGMRGAERRRFSSMQNAMVEAATGKKEELPAWVPSNPGKAGGNSVLDPKVQQASGCMGVARSKPKAAL